MSCKISLMIKRNPELWQSKEKRCGGRKPLVDIWEIDRENL